MCLWSVHSRYSVLRTMWRYGAEWSRQQRHEVRHAHPRLRPIRKFTSLRVLILFKKLHPYFLIDTFQYLALKRYFNSPEQGLIGTTGRNRPQENCLNKSSGCCNKKILGTLEKKLKWHFNFCKRFEDISSVSKHISKILICAIRMFPLSTIENFRCVSSTGAWVMSAYTFGCWPNVSTHAGTMVL